MHAPMYVAKRAASRKVWDRQSMNKIAASEPVLMELVALYQYLDKTGGDGSESWAKDVLGGDILVALAKVDTLLPLLQGELRRKYADRLLEMCDRLLRTLSTYLVSSPLASASAKENMRHLREAAKKKFGPLGPAFDTFERLLPSM
ncbi:hypothetical protein DXG03_009320 [Asterophora parasitica]|uniref:Uncharacterized protein n=1 Tax=Asterophora parasitica TaxID=117018 RepID=A0A9P7G6T4_9AGAR|nr:hypothetical protein DXG03_009320 [Asterophora parasitica]